MAAAGEQTSPRAFERIFHIYKLKELCRFVLFYGSTLVLSS